MIKINIVKRTNNIPNTKRTWVSFSAKMKLVVKGEESKGLQEKYVEVRFDESVKADKTLKTGTIEVLEENINAPYIYEIKEVVNESGETKKRYPYIWVSKVESFEAYKPTISQDSFC